MNVNAKLLPLYVDLDDSLIKTDLFLEGMIRFLKKNPLGIFRLVFWIFKSRSYAKNQIAKYVDISPESLPYNPLVLSYLKEQHKNGRQLFLATASNSNFANKISSYLKIFSGTIASDESNNLKGSKKLEKILKNHQDFAYLGDSYADIPLWKASKEAIFVGNNALKHILGLRVSFQNTMESKTNSLKQVLKLIRPHQWVKNILLFTPLLLSHKIFDSKLWVNTFIGFCAMNLMASVIYILNDILDIEADRLHPSKKNRAIANGDVSIGFALFCSCALFFTSLVLGVFLPSKFLTMLMVYFFVAMGYSFYIKTLPIFDIFCLSFFYFWRMELGSSATGIYLSHWLLLFSFFFFLSLAAAKRTTDLMKLPGNIASLGRGYWQQDSLLLTVIGIGCALCASVTFGLYVSSDSVKILYTSLEPLFGICILLTLWQLRLWVLASRGILNSDPVLYALKDPFSYFALGLVGMLLFYAAI